MIGEMTHTETRKAEKPDQPSFCVRIVKMKAAAKACAPKAKLNTPVAWYVSTRLTATMA